MLGFLIVAVETSTSMVEETMFWGIVGPMATAIVGLSAYIVYLHKTYAKKQEEILDRLIKVTEADTEIKTKLAGTIEVLSANISRLDDRLDTLSRNRP